MKRIFARPAANVSKKNLVGDVQAGFSVLWSKSLRLDVSVALRTEELAIQARRVDTNAGRCRRTEHRTDRSGGATDRASNRRTQPGSRTRVGKRAQSSPRLKPSQDLVYRASSGTKPPTRHRWYPDEVPRARIA
jgi:hypothetical protein